MDAVPDIGCREQSNLLKFAGVQKFRTITELTIQIYMYNVKKKKKDIMQNKIGFIYIAGSTRTSNL